MTAERGKFKEPRGKHKSKKELPPILQNFSRDYLESKYTELYPKLYKESNIPNEDYVLSFLGHGGDCGNFAIALNRHLGNKGKLLACINQVQDWKNVEFSHVLLEYEGTLIDENGIHTADSLDNLKEVITEKWVDNPDLWEMYSDKYVWEELSKEKRLEILEPTMVSVTEQDIKDHLRTTYEDRITHIRDFFYHLEGKKFNPKKIFKMR